MFNKQDRVAYIGPYKKYKGLEGVIIASDGHNKGEMQYIVRFGNVEATILERVLKPVKPVIPTYNKENIPGVRITELNDPNTLNYADAFVYEKRNGSDVAVNLTEMAKKFGKDARDWFQLKSSNDYITANNLGGLFGAKDGRNGGTWSYDNSLTIEFARWLSPKFSYWCNKKIEELMLNGRTEISTFNMPTTYADALRMLAEKVEKEEKLLLENKKVKEELEESKPKAEFYDSFTHSNDGKLIGTFAKQLYQNGQPFGQNRFFKYLRNHKYLGSYGEYYNKPNQQYVEQGLFIIKQTTWNEPNGTNHTSETTLITPKGQEYFLKKFGNK